MGAAKDISGLPPAEQEKILKRRERERERNSKRNKERSEQSKEKLAEVKKNWRQNNKERIAKQAKEYREARKETEAKRRKEYRDTHKESEDTRNRLYRLQNAETIRAKRKKSSFELRDSNLRSAFCNKVGGLKCNDVPAEILPILREKILFGRAIRDLNREICRLNSNLKGN